MVFLWPFLTAVFKPAVYDRVAEIMARREGIQALMDAIEAFDLFWIGCIGEFVQHEDPVIRMIAVPAVHQIAADEAGPAGDEDGLRHQASFANSGWSMTSARASCQVGMRSGPRLRRRVPSSTE